LTIWSKLNDMSAAVGIDSVDVSAVQRNLDLLRDVLPDTVADLYRHLHALQLGSVFDGVDLQHLAARQVAHWEALFGGRFDTVYFANATRIGAIHRRRGVTQDTYLAAYGWFLMNLLARIEARGEVAGSPAVLRSALVKYVFLDMTIAAATFRTEDASVPA
jgi:hypothetical protein